MLPISHKACEVPDLIFIPQEARGQLITQFPISVRLANVLRSKGIRLFGDLHGLTFSGFSKSRNCGSKTLEEIIKLVHAVQLGDRSAEHSQVHPTLVKTPYTLPSIFRFSTARVKPKSFLVSADAQELNPFELPMSVRLENTLRTKRIKRLGELNGLPYSELLKIDGCGFKVLDELGRLLNRAATGEFRPGGPFCPGETGELLRSLDIIIAAVPPRNRDILLLRFGATDNKALTLEEIGSKFDLTRERVRQIVDKVVPALLKQGGPRLAARLRGIATMCSEMVVPLTPQLISKWVGQNSSQLRYSTGFYVRLMSELNPELPGWPKGQERFTAVPDYPGIRIVKALATVLRRCEARLPLREAFERTRATAKLSGIAAGDFLATVKGARSIVVEFPEDDEPQVRLRYLRINDVARIVLEDSRNPLTPEEIILAAKHKFGSELVDWNPRTVGNSLLPENGFYLLGPRAYGLRQHLSIPSNVRRDAKADFKGMLAKENRPISTTEIINRKQFPWTAHLNAYALAQILREDSEFIDLGRFLFALSTWGIEEREYIKDLIPKVLAKVGRPMTTAQIFGQLRRLRSTSPSSIPITLRKHPLLHNLGFGRYGLRSWGDSVKATLVSDAALIDRIIRRSEPPLTFQALCEILDVACESESEDKLWATCTSLGSVIASPGKLTPNTLMLHKSCSLERALVATARAVNRPMPVYEFQWELNTRFFPLFGQTSNAEVAKTLGKSLFFLRDADDEFILDVHLEQLGLDGKAIRRACLDILSEANEIVGCDDLIERLEAEGRSWEELSPDILGSLLRENKEFQEVGHNRFRAKPCTP